jgi:hypothetical protein
MRLQVTLSRINANERKYKESNGILNFITVQIQSVIRVICLSSFIPYLITYQDFCFHTVGCSVTGWICGLALWNLLILCFHIFPCWFSVCEIIDHQRKLMKAMTSFRKKNTQLSLSIPGHWCPPNPEEIKICRCSSLLHKMA